MKKLIITTFIICISVISFKCVNGKKSDSDKVVITFWHSFVHATIPALEALIDLYEKSNPDIKIRAQYVPTGEVLIQKLITSIQSNTAPDISWLHSHYLEDLVRADAIYAMKEFIDGPNGLEPGTLEDIYPALIEYSSWRGTLYSLPMEATNLALLYNKDMFRAAGLDPEKPPSNWEELYQYAKKLTFDNNNDGKFDQIGFFVPIYPATGPQGSWMVWQWKPFMWQAGGYTVNLEQTELLFNSTAALQALTLWKKIYQELKLNIYTTDFDVAFAAKHLAMAMDGPWNLPRYEKMLKNLDWAIAPLPAGPKKRATVVGGEYLAIFKQSKYPQQSWEFIKWILRPEIQAFWSMNSGYLPVRDAVLEVSEFQKYLDEHPNFKVFVEQMKHGQAERPIHFGGIEIQRLIAESIEKATVGDWTVEKALDEGVEKAQKILELKTPGK